MIQHELPPTTKLAEGVKPEDVTIVHVSGLSLAPTVTDCECAKSGRPVLEEGKRVFECKRDHCTKTLKMHDVCRTNAAMNEKWKAGKGPRQSKPGSTPRPTKPRGKGRKKNQPQWQLPPGPGSELYVMLRMPVKILGWLPRVKKMGCGGSCFKYAQQMNAWGTKGCRERMEEITDHLESQAKGLKMPFSRRAAKLLVKWAIRRAEKEERRQTKRVVDHNEH